MILGVTSALDKTPTHLLEKKKPHLLAQNIGTTNSASYQIGTAKTLNSPAFGMKISPKVAQGGAIGTIFLLLMTLLGCNESVKNDSQVNELDKAIMGGYVDGLGVKNYSGGVLKKIEYIDGYGYHVKKVLDASNKDPNTRRYIVTGDDGTGVHTGKETYYMSGSNLICEKSTGEKFTVAVEDGYLKFRDPKLNNQCTLAYKKEGKGTVGTYVEVYTASGKQVLGANNKPEMKWIGNLDEFKLNETEIALLNGAKGKVIQTLKAAEEAKSKILSQTNAERYAEMGKNAVEQTLREGYQGKWLPPSLRGRV